MWFENSFLSNFVCLFVNSVVHVKYLYHPEDDFVNSYSQSNLGENICKDVQECYYLSAVSEQSTFVLACAVVL